MPTNLVIGMGEVGSSIFTVIKEKEEEVWGIDSRTGSHRISDVQLVDGAWVYTTDGMIDKIPDIDFLHICLPNMHNFVEVSKDWANRMGAKIIINHSSTPPGTTRKIHEDAVHSPIRGMHPDMVPGLKTFVKFVSGDNYLTVEEAVNYLRFLGINAEEMPHGPESTELHKLLSTTRRALNIAFAQETERFCKQIGIPYTGFYRWEQTYNDGYERLELPEARRPIVFPGFIGRHCLMPNIEILRKIFTSEILDAVVNSNQKRKTEDDAGNTPTSESP